MAIEYEKKECDDLYNLSNKSISYFVFEMIDIDFNIKLLARYWFEKYIIRSWTRQKGKEYAAEVDYFLFYRIWQPR